MTDQADHIEHFVAEEPGSGKGLEAGAIGLWGNVAIGLASTAPAYSLAAGRTADDCLRRTAQSLLLW